MRDNTTNVLAIARALQKAGRTHDAWRCLWSAALQWEGIEDRPAFVIFSKDNPFDKAMDSGEFSPV